MIRKVTITDTEVKDILLFKEVDQVKKLNILFGGNGTGKTTFLNAIKEGKVELELEGDKNIIIKSFTNSIDNMKVNAQNKRLDTGREVVKLFNANSFSEGQSIIHYVRSFLYDIGQMETEDQIVVLLDEIDSGLSAENINLLLWEMKDLMDQKGVQFFVSSNHYHFIHTVKSVLSMYDGTYIDVESYQEYFDLLQSGIQVMKNSGKRQFNFLDIY